MSAVVKIKDRSRLRLWPRLSRALVRALFALLFRPRVEGEAPPRGQPYILIANHQGWADAFLLIALFPPEPALHFIADEQAVTHVWWKRAVIASLGTIVRVDRSHALDRSAIEVSLRYLASDAALVIFPEGRVSRAEGDLAPFQRGVAYLAMKARVPVLPVWLRGTAELYLGRELLVRIGVPRLPPEGQPTRQATETFAKTLHQDVAALASPWIEPPDVRKRWRWLTDIL